jgi:hypothetical protein
MTSKDIWERFMVAVFSARVTVGVCLGYARITVFYKTRMPMAEAMGSLF